MGTQGGGPPNKWADFQIDGLTGGEVLAKLNALARLGFNSGAFVAHCDNGTFVFVSGYSSEQ